MEQVLPVACLQDNYAWVIKGSNSRQCVVVDPSESEPVVSLIDRERLELVAILLTHHHRDHVGGVAELRSVYGCQVIGPELERSKLPALDIAVKEGAKLVYADISFAVLDTPGHTQGHVSYFCDSGWLFCGDVLFSLGCGRCFECPPEVLWHSLEKISALPGNTQVCCGHEYTLANARFALQLEPENPNLHARIEEVQRRLCSLPTLLEFEKRVNPFLKVAEQGFRTQLGYGDLTPAQAFAALRARKDLFT